VHSKARLSDNSSKGDALLIVLIDDEEPVRNVAQWFISENQRIPKSARFRQFGDGHSALEFLSTEIPDLVFIDVQMPGFSGIDVVNRMSGVPALRDVPTILMSAALDDSVLQKTRKPMVAFTGKPFNANDLDRALENVLTTQKVT